MTRRTSTFEDFLEIASRLPWRISIVAAVLAGAGLHVLAVVLSRPRGAPTVGDLRPIAALTLVADMAILLQFVLPAAFLIGAIASYVRQSQARGLLESAGAGGKGVIDGITWGEFERLIGETFRHRGYSVTETGGRRADGGVDLVLTKENERFLVQCKHWRARNVGVRVIRELRGVITADQATGGYVVTSGVFTYEARRFAESCNIELIDGDRLESLIRELGRKGVEGPDSVRRRSSRPELADVPQGPPSCPECGSIMKMRTAKRGTYTGQPFWGCSRYPACRVTRPIPVGSESSTGAQQNAGAANLRSRARSEP